MLQLRGLTYSKFENIRLRTLYFYHFHRLLDTPIFVVI
jgi:hypothetical protein